MRYGLLMPDTSDDHLKKALSYVKNLMSHTDMLDGEKDHKIDRKLALGYIDELIKRAEMLGCADEKEHLLLVKQVVQPSAHNKDGSKRDAATMEAEMNMPMTSGADYSVLVQWKADSILANKLREHPEGKKLLTWYDTHSDHCVGMGYLPAKVVARKSGNER